MAATQYYATGRRKTATARVFLRPGSGAIKVNHRTFESFFPTEALRTQIRIPLVLTGERIAWVVGHRIDDRFKITPATRQVLVLTKETR